MASGGRVLRWWSLSLLFYLPTLAMLTTDEKCSQKTECCSCVATPGCSWFYNITGVGDFCKGTPLTGSVAKNLEDRTPYRLEHEVEVPSDKNKPLDIRAFNKRDRVFMAPQQFDIRQGVGVRQEVIFKVMSNNSKLAFRIRDMTNHAVQYTLVTTQPFSCPGSPGEMKPGDVNFKLKWDGYSRAKLNIPIIVNGRKKKIKGEKSLMRVNCWRDLSKQRKETEFKLIIDTPTCFYGTRLMMIEMPWMLTKKRIVLRITNKDCQCPCQKKEGTTKLVDIGNFVQAKCRGKMGGKRKARKAASKLCKKQAKEVAKEMDCKAENDKCQQAPYQDMCSGNGTCVCGRCVCVPGQSGTHCECNDKDCPYHDGEMCGGPARGECDCGKCRCKGQHSGIACELNYTPDSCRYGNGAVCSGHGACINGKCHCHEMATGELCQDRDHCPNFRHCVECYVLGFDALSMDRFCARCKSSGEVVYKDISEMKNLAGIGKCQFRDSLACEVRYFYKSFIEGNRVKNTTVYVDSKPDCTGITLE